VLQLRWLAWEARRRLAGHGGADGAEAAPIPAEARVLAIRPDHLGDALLTTPALRLLKRALPTMHLTVLAGPWGEDVPAHCPAVDRVRVCRFPGFERLPPGESALNRLRRRVRAVNLLLNTASEVAEERYHLAINFRPDFWWGAALGALAAIPVRLGYVTDETAPFLSEGLPWTRPLVGTAARETDPTHVAEEGLALAGLALRYLGCEPPADFDRAMAYEPSAAERAEAWRLWRAHDLDEAPAVIALHAAPGAPVKRWEPQRFARVADHLAGRFGARVVITGGPGDVEEANQIATACWHKPVVLAGHTSFGVLAAFLDRCRFALGTDNGAMHLATARGVPALRLFGPIDAAIWGAWTGQSGQRGPAGPDSSDSATPVGAAAGRRGPGEGSNDTVSTPALALTPSLACAPCHRLDVPPWERASGSSIPAYPCMQDISVDRVIEAVEALWARTLAGR
jgi:ADP-heptose:LPS heptosyltransferase